MNWKRVKRSSPCPICGKPDWCGVSDDQTLACCMRVESQRPAKNGGWLHTIATAPQPAPRVYAPKPAPLPVINWVAMLDHLRRDTSAAAVAELSNMLGVSVQSLERMGACWASYHNAWAFPMHDEWGKVIGVRLRADDGRKWAIKGSRSGLFIPSDLGGRNGSLMICEGPTDTAAVLDLGFDAIGRHSCSGGVDLLVALLSRRRRDVVIVADRDGPGSSGAERLADAILPHTRSVRVIYPLQGKDARAWVNGGATRATIDVVISQARYWRRKEAI